MITDDIKELIERLLQIENEINLLQDDKKALFDEFKNKVDIKAFKAALQIAKIHLKLGDSEQNLEQISEVVTQKISL